MEKIRLDVVISFPSLVRRFPSVSNSVLCSFLSHLWSSFIKFPHTVDHFKISSGSSFTLPFRTTFVFKLFGFDIPK
jgi:hypothetical protein